TGNWTDLQKKMSAEFVFLPTDEQIDKFVDSVEFLKACIGESTVNNLETLQIDVDWNYIGRWQRNRLSAQRFIAQGPRLAKNAFENNFLLQDCYTDQGEFLSYAPYVSTGIEHDKRVDLLFGNIPVSERLKGMSLAHILALTTPNEKICELRDKF